MGAAGGNYSTVRLAFGLLGPGAGPQTVRDAAQCCWTVRAGLGCRH